MNRFTAGLIVPVVLPGNVLAAFLLLRDSRRLAGFTSDPGGSASQRQVIEALREEVGRLAQAVAAIRPASGAASDAAATGGSRLAARLDEVLQRLEALERSIAARTEASDELVQERDGDGAGLEAYRDVERLARAAGVDAADEAGKRAARIEERLANR